MHSDGTLADGDSFVTAISRDGRIVVFTSAATNLVDDDINGVDDVFVHDRVARTTTRISVADDGGEADGPSGEGRVSADGRFVVFVSTATTLVPDDTNGVADVFLYDRQAGGIERLSRASDGTQADGPSTAGRISPDGRCIAFRSEATNLGRSTDGWYLHERLSRLTIGLPHDGYGDADFEDRFFVTSGAMFSEDAVVHDRVMGMQQSLIVTHRGESPDSETTLSIGTPDGRFVIVESLADNLALRSSLGGSDRGWFVYLFDRLTGTADPVTVSATGARADALSYAYDVSPDGRFVLFESLARNLTEGDTHGGRSLYVRDLERATTSRIPVSSGPTPYTSLPISVLSGDGQHLAFSYYATITEHDHQVYDTPAGVEGVDAHPLNVIEVFAHRIAEPAAAP